MSQEFINASDADICSKLVGSKGMTIPMGWNVLFDVGNPACFFMIRRTNRSDIRKI